MSAVDGLPVPAPGFRCSDVWAGLSAFGTASPASFFVAVEQPGPWGRDAFDRPDLGGVDGGKLIEARVAAAGGRALLIRHPGRHVAWRTPHARHVLVAGGPPGAPWLLEGTVARDTVLASVDWGLATQESPDALLACCPTLALAREPALLVCTNSKRDLCCALKGRPIALMAAERHPGRVWECSHTGGHRFAPTGIVLPLGQYLARLTPVLALAALDAARLGRLAAESLGPVHDRGRGHLPAPQSAAESWVRAAVGETHPAALTVRAVEDGVVEVRHADGGSWRLAVERVEDEPLPESCGKAAVPARTWSVRPV